MQRALRWGLFAFVAASLLGCSCDHETTVEPAAAPVAVAPQPPPKPKECRISIPRFDGQVGVFPTEAGLKEYTRAAARGDSTAAEIAIRANGAMFVDRLTRCAYLDVGIASSQLRILEGVHQGRAGWLPNEWTVGD